MARATDTWRERAARATTTGAVMLETGLNGWLSGGSGAPAKPSKKRRGVVIGLVTAGLVAGGVLAGTLGASAANAPGSGGSYEGPPGPPPGEGGARPTGPGGRLHHADKEKKVSAAIAATLTTKALAKVPGATVDHVGQRPDGHV